MDGSRTASVPFWRNIGAWSKKFLAMQVLFSYLLLICSTSAEAATFNFEYDQAGNMISGQGKYYEYNAANQLVKVRKDAPSGPVIAEYVYDYQGQRVKKIENGITTYYIGKHYEERKGNTVNEKTNYIFVNGQRVAARIVKDNQSAAINYYLNNHLGSADAVTDAQGNVTERLRYYPYGEYRTQPNPKERHAYTGKERDEATEEYYYEARYYNPSIRRFAQADTVTPNLYDPQSLNKYAYTNNNPVRYIDPNGESATLAGALIGGLVGGGIALLQGQDMKHVAGAAVQGAVAGAIMGSVIDTGGASLGVMVLAGAGSNVAGGLAGRAVSGDQILSTESMLTDAASGAIGSGIGYAAGKILTRGLSRLSSPAIKKTIERHHFATNKNKTFTPRLMKIADQFGLDLDGAWNIELLPHKGRHANLYHDFVERGMDRAAREANGNTAKFLKLFNKYVKKPIRSNPEMTGKNFWK